MRKLFALLVGLVLCSQAFALLSLELTRGVAGAVPIIVSPFTIEGNPLDTDIAAVISHDLQNSGRFKVLTALNSADLVVQGQVKESSEGQYKVNFQLIEAFKSKNRHVLLNENLNVSESHLRQLAHHISDLIYQQITGVRGIFSTRLAYVVVQRTGNGLARYTLEVSDQDGFNPKPLISSDDPIMSPAWSPNGKQIAYVSFENQHAAIYVQDISTGARRLISEFPGINGAPAWSPDGKKLAIVLSKSGSPNIYTLDLASKQLNALTHDFYINTEPSWSPRGDSLIFTSNRSGNPQIYQINLHSRAVSRLTYDGKYNARGSFTHDGNHLVMLNQDSGNFNIGILDLNNNAFKILSNTSSDNESPSIAPNGSMVLYGTIANGTSVLGMVATDSSVELKLPARQGEVQDPAWSPFLS